MISMNQIANSPVSYLKSITGIVIIVAGLIPAIAGPPELIGDLYPGFGNEGSYPTELTPVGSNLYFQTSGTIWRMDAASETVTLVTQTNPSTLAGAADGLFFVNSWTSPNSLWFSDGTSAGTRYSNSFSDPSFPGSPAPTLYKLGLLRPYGYYLTTYSSTGNTVLIRTDGRTGESRSVSISGYFGQNPMTYASKSVGANLYFTAHSSVGAGLYMTDGTLSAATSVKTLPLYNPSYNSNQSQLLVEMGGILFLQGGDATSGRELWKSDGTDAGTSMVADIRPGTGHSMDSLASAATAGGFIYFAATDGTNGTELWRSDGTAGGTEMIKDINNGSGSSAPNAFTAVGNTIYFTATNTGSGRELWKTDGTAGGTVMVKEIGPAAANAFGATPRLVELNGNLVFVANDGTSGEELWKSDGSSVGTQMVSDLRAGAMGSSPDSLTNFNGKVYFTADNGLVGRELWSTDGASASLVADLAGENSSEASFPTAIGTTSFFAAKGPLSAELWKTDGTQAGTVKVKDFGLGSQNSLPNSFTPLGNKLLFNAYTSSSGAGLWISDGTEGGTTLLGNIANSGVIATLGSQVIFNANTGRLYRTDGTPGGTYQIAASTASTSTIQRAVVGSNLFLALSDSTNGEELWKTDGTVPGTLLVKDIRLGSSSSSINFFFSYNGLLFFRATDVSSGTELWKSDGTTAGTVMVKDIWAGTGGSSPDDFVESNGILYFEAGTAENGRELWSTDGTELGTQMVADIRPGTDSILGYRFFSFNNKLFFGANNGGNGNEIWMTDGTMGGTQMLKDINPGIGSSNPFPNPSSLVIKDGVFYFPANDGTGVELWKSDGTEAGTMMVKDIEPSSNSGIKGLFAFGDHIYFQSFKNGLYDTWRTDGTEAGTLSVTDLESGLNLREGIIYTPVGNNLYFRGNSSISGYELWMLKDDAPRAWPIADILPGSGSSNPLLFHPANDSLFILASAPVTGKEPYLVDPVAPELAYVMTKKESSVTTSSATLNGLVFPQGTPTTADFEYGSTFALGSSLPVTLSPSNGTEPQDVSASLSGLSPGTRYFYRLVSTNAVGNYIGETRSFRTVSDDASLAVLTTGAFALSPAFSSGVLDYAVAVDAATSALTVINSAEDPEASISVDGSIPASGYRSSLVVTNPGTTEVSVQVVASDGLTSKIYTLTIIRPPAPEISVTGNGVDVRDGDSSPSTTDGTDHGSVETGTSSSRQFVITNNGTEPLTIGTPIFAGSQSGDFEVTTFPAAILQGGQTTTLVIAFTPSVLGIRTAAFSFPNNDGDENPFNFTIRGTGIVPQIPEIVVEYPTGNVLTTNPSQIDFGNVTPGSSGTPQIITIRNTGTSALIGLELDFFGVAANDFIIEPGMLGTSLAPGGSATFMIAFSPSSGGLRQASVEIASNDADENPFVLTLSGTGVANYNFSYSLNPSTVDANGTVVLTFAAVTDAPLQLAENSAVTLPQFQSYNFINTCAFGNYPYSYNSNRVTTVNGLARTGNLSQPISFTLCAGSLSIGSSSPVTWALDAGGGDRKTLTLVIGNGSGGWMPGTFTLAELNDPPIAVISSPSASLPLGIDLTLDGVSSYDLDGSGHIVSWEWDLESDGVFEHSGPILTVLAENFPGSWIVGSTALISLRVTDNSGATNVATISPIILPEPIPSLAISPVSQVTVADAILNGSVDPNGYSSVAEFEWGLTLDYGNSVPFPLNPDNGTEAQQGIAALSALIQSTTYHYRLTVANTYGTFHSPDNTFTTHSPLSMFAGALTNSFLIDDDALPNATPFNDGVENLLKYAFNMNLAGPDVSTLLPGTGISGLPSITTPDEAPPGTLRFEFVRRKGSGLTYTPQKSTSLDDIDWAPLSSTPVVTSIDEQWERVTYEEPPGPGTVARCFGRVEVTLPRVSDFLITDYGA